MDALTFFILWCAGIALLGVFAIAAVWCAAYVVLYLIGWPHARL